MRFRYPRRTDRLNQQPPTRPLTEARLMYETHIVWTAEPGGVTPTVRQFSHLSRQ
jgi:hypothetical protein